MNIINKLKGYKNLPETVKASLWYTICNITTKGLALFSTPIFTRLLTKDQYGTFSIFYSWYNILMIFGTLNIFQNCYNKGLITYKDDRESYTSSMLGLTTVLTLIMTAIYLIGMKFWTGVFELSPLLMLTMFFFIITSSAKEFWAAKERFDYKYKKYVIITIVTIVLSIVTGIIAVLATEYKAEARILTDVCSKAIFGLAIYVILMKEGKRFVNLECWKYALVFTIPLIPHFLSTYVLNQADRLMISKMTGTADAAVYSVAYTISTMMLLVINAINNSLIPYIYKTINGNEHVKDIKKYTRPLFALIMLLCMLTMCFAPEIIYIFAGREYADAISIIPSIAASLYFIFVYYMFSTVEYYYEKTGMIALASAVSTILNLILNYIFIGLYGYKAAGYTTLACYMVLAVFHYVFYRRILKEELPDIKHLYDMKMIMGCSVFILLFMLVMLFSYNWLAVRYGILLLLGAVVFVKRKDLIKALGSFK